MSLITAAHTFAGWAEKVWAKIYQSTPKVEQVIAATLKYAGPALQMVVAAEAGQPAGAIVGKVIGDAQAGLVAASGLVYDFGAHPTIQGVLTGVQGDLSGLLAAGHVSNPKNVEIVNKVVAELAALAGSFSPAGSTLVTSTAA